MTESKTPARMVRFENLDFVPRAEGGDQAQLAEICGTSDGTELGCGLARMRDARLDWTVKYDEVLFVLEGRLRVHTADGVMEAGPHDAIWLPKGTALTYEAERALVFFAIHPAGWAQQDGS